MRTWHALLMLSAGGAALAVARPALLQSAVGAGDGGELSPSNRPAQNAAALSKIFASQNGGTFRIPAGTFTIPCGSSFVAAGPISLIGAGMAQTVLRLDHPCVMDRPLMQWVSKSGVHLSAFQINLNHARYNSVQDVLSFQAYRGNASGLQIDHISVINGTSPSLQIGVAAADGFTYSDVLIENNRLQMTPARTQNQCIALINSNSSGKIPGARIIGNTCIGSAIQGVGDAIVIADNDVSGFQFGSGIFIAFATKAAITSARWTAGTATLQLNRATSHLMPGETAYVWSATPSGYNGTFRIIRAEGNSVSYALPGNPGPYVEGGFISPEPGSHNCVIRNNFIHDTGQSLDVNRSSPGGISNSCIDSLVINNRLQNLGGPGFFNYADGARYVQNRAVGVGYGELGNAGGEAGDAAFVSFDNGTGVKGYQSSNVTFDGNEVVVQQGRPRFGYYEEPYHRFSATLDRNNFNGSERRQVVRSPTCRAGSC